MSVPTESAWESLRATVDTLLGENGCAWCAKQTHHSLVPYLIEESAELVDAIETGSPDDRIEELGDVAFQVLFHANIAERSGEFTLDDVFTALTAKIVRRNPHVFGPQPTRDIDEILARWHEAKALEKQHRTSVLDGVAFGMSALALADKVIGKGEQRGVPGPELDGGVPSLAGEAAFGDALLAAVSAAREAGIDAERALRDAVRRHAERIRAAEQRETTQSPAAES